MKRLSKQNRILMSIVVIFVITIVFAIAYAAFSQILNINGSALVNEDGSTPLVPSYSVGDQITVAGEQYYVITDSDSTQDYVTALKNNPLTVEEVNLYGEVGTDNNHVNKYKSYSQGHAYNMNGYGGILYYSSLECGYVNGQNVNTNCILDYDQSDIKYVVDVWTDAKFINGELAVIDGYKSRLIKIKELLDNFDYIDKNTYYEIKRDSSIPNWSCSDDDSKRYY